MLIRQGEGAAEQGAYARSESVLKELKGVACLGATGGCPCVEAGYMCGGRGSRPDLTPPQRVRL